MPHIISKIAFLLVFSGLVLPVLSEQKWIGFDVQIQQQFEIYSMTNEGGNAAKINVSAHPNSTAGLLMINVPEKLLNDLSYGLYEETGTLLINERLYETNSRIFLKSMPSAIYYLRFYSDGKEIKAFKIVKNR